MALIRIKDRHFLAASRSSTSNFHPLSLYIFIYITFLRVLEPFLMIRETDFSSIVRRQKYIYIFSRRTRDNDVPSRINISSDYCAKLRKGKRIDLIGTSKIVRARKWIFDRNALNMRAKLFVEIYRMWIDFPGSRIFYSCVSHPTVYQLIARQSNVY